MTGRRQSGLGTWAKRNAAPILVSKFASSLPDNPTWPGTHWKLRAMLE